ncbi:hypothetical protein LPB136_12535 [Tenacibaculum todarodis]|uniref:Uncharacterized protein n=2 Tax=Tenacibaculum todarodis TaxID=1850252 RepID=A0A1L3JLV9_9FLAO|nr:hypothetical protein LPB136_12535 [Tenacibaculum todarodis]
MFKYKSVFLRTLTLLLFTTVVIESIGTYFRYVEDTSFNNHYYHFYNLIFLSIVTFLFFKIIKGGLWRKIMIILFSIFLIIWSLFFINNKFFYSEVIFESITISSYSILYLRELLISDKIINYKKLLPFWVSISFLIFYLPAVPFLAALKYMNDRGSFPVLHVLIILMNLFIIFGLLYSDKEENV